MLEFHTTRRTFHFRKPAATSRGALLVRELLLVEARDTDWPQTVGSGECGPIPGLSSDDHPDWASRAEALAAAITAARLALPLPLPSDPPGDALEAVTALLAPFEAELAAEPSFRFGIETALLDLLGHCLSERDRGVLFPSAFTSGMAPLPTHGLLWMDSSAGLLRQAEGKLAEGFRVLKMKIGALPLDEELAILRVLREQHLQIGIRLDANGAFSPEEAGSLLERLAPLRIELVEQPIAPGQHDALEALVGTSPVAIGIDEELIPLTQPQRLALVDRLAGAHRVPPVLIIKPALLGGFAPSAELADHCVRRGIHWLANSLLEAAIGHHAICQWTAQRLERAILANPPIHGLGSGQLFSDNLPSPIVLRGARLEWIGFTHAH